MKMRIPNFPMTRRQILFSILLLTPLPARAAPNADNLLRAMTAAEKNLNYNGTMQVARKAAPSAVVKIWKSGAKRRLEWQAPPIMRGDVMVDDGQSVWRYHRAENSAVQTRGAAHIDWDRLSRTMNASMAGNGTVAGRAAWIVNLRSKDNSQPALKVWIDQKNMARLGVERAGGETMKYQSINFAAVPAGQFQWSPPAGARVTRTGGTLYSERTAAQRAADWLQLPNHLPKGYEFESAVIDASGAGGRGEAWLRFANGINRFSIFQQRTADTTAFKVQRAGDGWFVQQGGSRFMILGLPDSEAQKVLNSLR